MKPWDAFELDRMQSFASEVLGLPLRRVDPRYHPSLPSHSQRRQPIKQIIIPRRLSTFRDDRKPVPKPNALLASGKTQTTQQSRSPTSAVSTRDLHAQTARLKSVTLIEQNKPWDKYRDRRRKGREEAGDLLGSSSDSMMVGGEIILMDLYDRSKKIQSQTKKKGYDLHCLALSPRSSALQPRVFASVHQKTEELKRRLNTVGQAWGVRLDWNNTHSDAQECEYAGKLAQVTHRISQETLRVLGNR